MESLSRQLNNASLQLFLIIFEEEVCANLSSQMEFASLCKRLFLIPRANECDNESFISFCLPFPTSCLNEYLHNRGEKRERPLFLSIGSCAAVIGTW